MDQASVAPIFSNKCAQPKKNIKRDDGLIIGYWEQPHKEMQLYGNLLKASFLNADEDTNVEMIYYLEENFLPKNLVNKKKNIVGEYYKTIFEKRYCTADKTESRDGDLMLCWGTPCHRDSNAELTAEELSDKILVIEITPYPDKKNNKFDTVSLTQILSYVGATYLGNRLKMLKNLQ